VAGPKYVDSFPGEPAPEEATLKPLLFRKTWRALTSEPDEPMVRDLVNGEIVEVMQELETGRAEGAG